MTNSFTQFSEAYSPRIHETLDVYTQQIASTTPPELHQAMRYSLLLPCKRIRPLLVLLSTEVCGGDIEEALPAACAVEMVHTFSLIHDDLPAMDDDDLRRGQPSNHKVYGEAEAILAGDGLLAYAFEVVANSKNGGECCAILARATGPAGMTGGQSIDMHGLPKSAKQEDIEHMHLLKTGALIQACCTMGACIAGANDAQKSALEEYAQKLGLLFQLTDDVLDAIATPGQLGKTVGKDEAQGKVTFVSLLGAEGSMKYAEKLAKEAKDSLISFDDSEILEDLVEVILRRNN